jgi:hypothetical protein
VFIQYVGLFILFIYLPSFFSPSVFSPSFFSPSVVSFYFEGGGIGFAFSMGAAASYEFRHDK